MLLRRGRLALAGFLTLLLLATGAMLLVRRALDGGSLRSAAEVRLSAMLGEPVRIGGMTIGVFPRSSVVGHRITVAGGTAAAPSVQIERITLLPKMRSIFRPPIVIDDVRVEGLVVSVLRDRTGHWHVPTAVPAPTGGGGGGPVVREVHVAGAQIRVIDDIAPGERRQASSIEALDAGVVSTDTGLVLSPVTARIGSAAIRGTARTDAAAAHLEFAADAVTDADLPAFLGIIGVTRPDFLRLRAPAAAAVMLTIDRRTSRLSARGTLRAPDLGVEPLRLQEVETPFRLDASQLAFDPLVFRLHGGTHRGRVTVDLSTTPARWGLDSRLTAIDLGGFLKTLSGADARIDGTAGVSAVLHGRVNEALADTVAGRARVTITDGVVRQFPLLATINRAVRITEGDSRDTRFERLTATLALGSGRATTDDLVLEAGQVRVEAAGSIGFDRVLALRGKAILSPERTASAIQRVRELSGLRNSRGELEIPLTISGTLDAPSFRLDLKAAIGRGLRNELRRRLDDFIRR